MNARVNNIMLPILARPVERFLGIDLGYVFRGGSWLLIGKIFGSFIAFFLSVAYARYLPKSVYGDYRYVLSVLSIAGIFALPGMATAITRGVARGYEGTFRMGGQIIFFSSFGITLVGFVLAAGLFFHGQSSLAWGFIIASLIVPFVEGLGNWRGYYDGKSAFKEKTILNLYDQLFYALSMFLAIGIIVLFRTQGPVSLLVLLSAYSLGEGIPNTLFFLKTFKKVPKDSPAEPGSVRYGLHLSLMNIPATIANYLDAVLLHAFIGPVTLATYSFAIALPEQLKAFLSLPADIVFPKLSTQTPGQTLSVNLKKTLPKKIFKSSFITLVIVLIYIAMAPFVYKILFPKYLDAILFSQVFALSLILFPFTIFNTALKAEGNIKKIYVYNIGAPMIQIAVLAVLIPIYGLWGAILGRIIGRLTNYLLPFLLFKK